MKKIVTFLLCVLTGVFFIGAATGCSLLPSSERLEEIYQEERPSDEGSDDNTGGDSGNNEQEGTGGSDDNTGGDSGNNEQEGTGGSDDNTGGDSGNNEQEGTGGSDDNTGSDTGKENPEGPVELPPIQI